MQVSHTVPKDRPQERRTHLLFQPATVAHVSGRNGLLSGKHSNLENKHCIFIYKLTNHDFLKVPLNMFTYCLIFTESASQKKEHENNGVKNSIARIYSIFFEWDC